MRNRIWMLPAAIVGLVAVTGCGPTPSSAMYDEAPAAANLVCGTDNWTMENISNQPFGASEMLALQVNCSSDPGREPGDYPALLAQIISTPVDKVKVYDDSVNANTGTGKVWGNVTIYTDSKPIILFDQFSR